MKKARQNMKILREQLNCMIERLVPNFVPCTTEKRKQRTLFVGDVFVSDL